MMASVDQLKLVGLSCDYYDGEGTTSSLGGTGISCETCKNWDGRKCRINVFDSVLEGLDQT
jgi:hypothetical protein